MESLTLHGSHVKANILSTSTDLYESSMATILHSSNTRKSLLKKLKIYLTCHESSIANKISGRYQGDYIKKLMQF